MPTEDDFVQALLDDPDDYTTRLVFADWLEEHGNAARGEFLRVQTELARWVPDQRRRTELLTRQRQLLAEHEIEWRGRLGDWAFAWRWEAGMAHVAVRLLALGDLSRRWLRCAWVRSVRVSFPSSAFPALTRNGVLLSLPALDLSGNDLSDGDVSGLFWMKRPGRLRELKLANNRLSSLRALSRSPLLGKLTHLDLRNNRITAEGVDMVLSSPLASRLKWIDFYGNDLDTETLCKVAAWREQRSPDRRRFTNALGMDFTLIPAGTFLMGSPETEAQRYDDEGPQHEVALTRPFYLGVYAVTQRQYEAVMGSNPSHFGPGNGGTFNHPVESVSWQEAVEFCRRLSALPEEAARGRTYRLPTEAEWEHACRAGGDPAEPFHFGASLSSTQANFNGTLPYGGAAEGPWRERTVPVGCFPPNAFGLFDMHGNTWEWCADHFDERYYSRSPRRNPRARPRTGQRVCRGGSWHSPGHYCRSADRGSDSLSVHDSYYGFRIACDTDFPA